jgi:CO dehydrogenase/acetyl-CoA synthase beta subunit
MRSSKHSGIVVSRINIPEVPGFDEVKRDIEQQIPQNLSFQADAGGPGMH